MSWLESDGTAVEGPESAVLVGCFIGNDTAAYEPELAEICREVRNRDKQGYVHWVG